MSLAFGLIRSITAVTMKKDIRQEYKILGIVASTGIVAGLLFWII